MEIEQLCQTARSQGAYGAKLSGAGGGGIVVALTGEAQTADADERAARVLHAWSNIGYDGFKVRMKGVDT